MNKVLTIEQGIKICKKIKAANKTIVVVGGFFDILHLGHIKFLEESKKYGDFLFVLLEDDAKAKKEKGAQRPVNSQKDRAKILSSIKSVNYVILLKNVTNNHLYDKIMVEMQPTVIATTYGDPYVSHKKRQAKLVQGRVVYVIKRIDNYSTTKYIKSTDIK
jgi:rfaE bifunctional protein nucleotidyltransferase chain/domain